MRPARLALLGLALLAAAVYANAPANGFALDDDFIIVQNERVHGFDRLDEALLSPYWPGAPGRIAMYRPVTSASFAIGWGLWGADPTGFHVTNVLLHVAVTLLVFLLLRMLAGVLPAAAGAAVFAVHPVHVEAVANVVGRGELLAALFCLAACLVHLRAAPPPRPRDEADAGAGADAAVPGGGRDRTAAGGAGWGTAVAVGILYFLGLASKEIAVTLPAVLVLLDLARAGLPEVHPDGARPPRESPVRRVLLRWPVYAATVVALGSYLALRAAVIGAVVGNDTAPFLEGVSAGHRVLTAVSVWPEYLRLMFFPRDLVADYSPGVIMPAAGFDAGVVAGLLTGALALLVAYAAWGRVRLVSLGIAWFAVVVLPVSNLLFPVGIALAERTLYLPSVGLSLGVAGVGAVALRAPVSTRRLAAAGLALALGLGAARAWARTPTWKNSRTAMEALARDHPESFRVQWIFADQLLRAGRADQSIELYQHALQLMPAHYQLRSQFGQALLSTGRTSAAIAQFVKARELVPEHPEGHVLHMAALLRAGRPAEAVDVGRQALELGVRHRGIHHQLAIALAHTGRYAEALDQRRTSIRMGGDNVAWTQRFHEAELLLRVGRREDAADAIARAREAAGDPVEFPDTAALRAAIEARDTELLPYP